MTGLFSLIGRWMTCMRPPEISPENLFAAIDSGAAPVLIDVRTSGEWDAGHIEGAVHIPIHRLARARDIVMPLAAASPCVVVCEHARRSVPGVFLLRKWGVDDVCQLRGGMEEWRKSGFPDYREKTKNLGEL